MPLKFFQNTMEDKSESAQPPQNIRIRKAYTREIPELCRFLIDMARESEGLALDEEKVKAGVARIFDEPELGTYWVLENTETTQLIGMTLITVEWSDWHNAPYWWFQSVYIHPDCRGQGMVRFLMAAIEQEAHKEGVKELRLYVEKNNQPAIHAYTKGGYTSDTYLLMQKVVKS